MALQSGVATFAVGGHAECVEPCASLRRRGNRPRPQPELRAGCHRRPLDAAERPAHAALHRRARDARPGSRVSSPRPIATRSYSPAEAACPSTRRCRPADSEGGAAGAFGAAFASFAAPFGEGATPGGVSTANIPAGPAPGPGARTHYAFDSTGPAGTVRVIVIDNSRGSLAASDPYQNPAQAQGPWLAQMLADAKARGIPAIVVGSRELNPNLPPALNVATDAGEEATIMVQGGASAYLYERPEESRSSRIPSGAAVTIPEYGTGALGYRSSISGSFKAGPARRAVRHHRLSALQCGHRQTRSRHQRSAGERAPDPARAVGVARPGRRHAAAAQRARPVHRHRAPTARGRPLGSGFRVRATVQTRPAPTPTANSRRSCACSRTARARSNRNTRSPPPNLKSPTSSSRTPTRPTCASRCRTPPAT